MRAATSVERRLLARGLRRWRGPQLPNGIPAREHVSPRSVNQDQLAIGTKVETEHTSNPTLAVEIALAHLREDPRYYAKLERMELRGSGGSRTGLVALGVVLLLVGGGLILVGRG